MDDHLVEGTAVGEASEDGRLTCRYRYRLRVTPSQASALQAVFDADRVVWNIALGRWNDLWRYERIHYGRTDMCRELTDWRGRFDWLAAQPSQCQQQMLRDLDRTICAFYDATNRAGHRPGFKKKASVTSARWVQHFAIRNGRLAVAVAGGRIPLRVVWQGRPLPSAPTSVTVYRDSAGHWWASFVVRIEPEALPLTGAITGLDVGLTTYATTEFPDADVANPRFGRAAAKAAARSRRNLDRTQKGSRRRLKAKAHFARLTTHVTNQRRDFTRKQARTLALRFDRIGVEDLEIQNMTRGGKGRGKVGLNRAIGDAGWGHFLLALEWQAKKCGHEVVRLPARNTTQNCSACGTKAKVHVGIKQRTFECSECGLVLDRDRNAARNLNPGWAVPGAPDDGSKTSVPAGTGAARGTESGGFSTRAVMAGGISVKKL